MAEAGGRRGTTWYLQKVELTPEEMNELAFRVMDGVKELASSALFRFPALGIRTRTTEVADEALMELLDAWKSYSDRKHFRMAAKRCIEHNLVDLWRQIKAKKRESELKAMGLRGDEIDEDAVTPERKAELRECVEAFFEVLDDLGAEQPEACDVFCGVVVGVSQRELSRNLGISRYEVDKRFRSASRYIAERMPADCV